MRLSLSCFLFCFLPVSIHALLAECDTGFQKLGPFRRRFNPRTPCGVRRPAQAHGTRSTKFQSTHSLRSATYNTLVLMLYLMCFNPRTPCGVRLENSKLRLPIKLVSIHALLAECDQWTLPRSKLLRCFNPRTPCGVRPARFAIIMSFPRFQSTHSLRSATFYGNIYNFHVRVSIHALLAECDRLVFLRFWPLPRFNPRTPCGVRHGTCPGR